MSGWGLGWFGGGAQQKESPKHAILGLRSQLEMLSKRETHLQNQIDEQDTLARKYISGNRNAAKAALRRKHQFEHALKQTNDQVLMLERQVYSIEAANINKETMEAIKKAGTAMKQIHGGLTVDKVDQTMEELREQHAIGEEIGEAITQSIGNQGLDETELDEQLEALQQEQLDEEMLKAGPTPADRLPSAPEAGVKMGKQQTQEDEEDELRKLQAEMAM